VQLGLGRVQQRQFVGAGMDDDTVTDNAQMMGEHVVETGEWLPADLKPFVDGQ